MALASIIYGGRYEIAAGVGIIFFAGGYLIGKSLVAAPNDNLWYLLTGFTADGKAVGSQGSGSGSQGSGPPSSTPSGPVPPPDPYATTETPIPPPPPPQNGGGSGGSSAPATSTQLETYKAILNGPQPGFTPRTGTVDPARLLSDRLNYETVALYVYRNNSQFTPEELQKATRWLYVQNNRPTSDQLTGFDTNLGNHWASFNVIADLQTINKAYPPDNDTFTNTHGFNDATDRIIANPNYYPLEAVHRAQLWDAYRKGGPHPGRSAYVVTDDSPQKRELTIAYQQQQNRTAEANGRPIPYPNAGTGASTPSGSSGTPATPRPGTGPATTAPPVSTPLPPGGGGSSTAHASTSTVPSADPAAQASPTTPPSQTVSPRPPAPSPPAGGRGSASASTGTPRPPATHPPPPAPPSHPATSAPARGGKTPQQLAGLRVHNRSRRL
jgi:hypothetical protein